MTMTHEARNTAAAPGKDRSGQRTDIQGLRALAVALVVLFHLWPNRLTGGYVGVDVFFVISGYLIIGHLVRETASTGSVSLLDFWSRRIRRLLPAAFLVLAACLVIAWFIGPGSQLRENLVEILGSALYVENWVLASNSIDYLAADNAPSLVQHFWSLSVEEQFYIVWPLLIVAAVWAAVRSRRFPPRRAILVVLTVVFVASLAWSAINTYSSPASAYFVTTTRAWEFAAGGLLGFLPARLLSAGREPVRAAVAWLAATAIVLCAFWLNAESPFPGIVALLPVSATVVLIAIGETTPAWSLARLARLQPIQALGDASYSLYLWHWPLIVVAPLLIGAPLNVWSKIAVGATAILLALLTKTLVEDPMRFRVRWFQQRLGAFLFAAIGIVLVVSLIWSLNARLDQQDQARAAEVAELTACLGAAAMVPDNGCTQPFAVTDTVDPTFAAGDVFYGAGSALSSGACGAKDDGKLAHCEFGDLVSPSVTIGHIGSSVGEHLVEPLAQAAAAQGWRYIPEVRAACDGFMTPTEAERRIEQRLVNEAPERTRSCPAWGDAAFEYFTDRDDVDIVLINSRGVIATPEAVAKVQRLVASGKQVYFIDDLYQFPGPGTAPACVEAAAGAYDPCAFNVGDLSARAVALKQSFGIDTIPMWPNYCSADGTCHVVVGGLIVYFDADHFTLSFSRTLVPYLVTVLDPIIAKATQS